MLVMVCEHCAEETGKVKQVVQRCDNESCVAVVVSRWPKSAALEVALTIVEEVETAYDRGLLLEGIPTKENVAADELSHQNWDKAATALAGLGDYKLVRQDMRAEVQIGAFVGSFEEFAREAEARVRNALSERDVQVVGE